MATERRLPQSEAKDSCVPVVSPHASLWARWDLTNEVGNKATPSHIPTGRIFTVSRPKPANIQPSVSHVLC